MKVIQIIGILICMSCSPMIFGQIKDKENKSIRIPAEIAPKEKDSTPKKIKVAPKLEKEEGKIKNDKINGISVEGVKKFKFKESKKPFSMTDNDGLKSSAEIFEERWNKEAVKGGIIRTMSDQFLGSHRVDTEFVNIVCRDHKYPDGDRVQIIVNGVVVHKSILLTGSYRRVEIDLVQGKNIIDILALNQGESGPNTAEFVVYDDKGSVISSKEWNLLTGVKARIIFNNEKAVIKEKSASDQASNN